MDEKSGVSFADFVAQLSGNRDLLERFKLEKQIAGLEAEKKTFAREKADQMEKCNRLVKENEAMQHNIDSAAEDARRFEQNRGGVITLDGVTLPEGLAVGSPEWSAEIGKALWQIADTARTEGKHVTVGSVCGFPLSVKSTELIDGSFDSQFFVSGSRLMYIVNKTGHLNRTSATLSASLPVATLERLPEIISGWQERLDENRQRIQQLQIIVQQEWGKEDALKKLRADLAMLDRKISKQLNSDSEYKQAA